MYLLGGKGGYGTVEESVRRRRDEGGTAVGRDTRASETDELTRPREDGAGGGGRPAPNHVAGEPRFVWVKPSAIDEEQNEEKRLRAGPTIRRKTRKQGKIGGASVGPVLPPPLPPPDAALLPPPFIVPGQ